MNTTGAPTRDPGTVRRIIDRAVRDWYGGSPSRTEDTSTVWRTNDDLMTFITRFRAAACLGREAGLDVSRLTDLEATAEEKLRVGKMPAPAGRRQ